MSLTKKTLTSFFVSFKNWFFLSFLMIFGIGLALFFIQERNYSRNLENLSYVEELESLLNQWEGSTLKERDSLMEILEDKFSLMENLSFGGDTLARSLFIQGKYELFVTKNQKKALELFKSIPSKSYQYPLALIYQGYIYEEESNWDLALVTYEKLSQEGEDFFKAQGVFHQGILREKKGELDLAISLYSSLVESYPTYVWGQLSQNRLIYLELSQN